MLEFVAIGTAVRKAGAPPCHEPFLSSLSGQDHWMLREAGYRPVGFALGNCTWYQIPNWQTRNATTSGFFGSGWTNQELADFTQAMYAARELAMGRMSREAEAVGAEGIVGVSLDPHVEIREVDVNNSRRIDLIAHFTAIGTAVIQESGGPRSDPSFIISLGT